MFVFKPNKNMNKVYTLLAAALLIAGTASAQKKVNIKFQITSPANGSTVTWGTPLNQMVVGTILGPGTLAATDTIFMHDPFNTAPGNTWPYTGRTKGVNDTVHFMKTYNPTTGNGNGTRDYCVWGFVRSGANTTNDSSASSSPSRTCNTFTATGGVGVSNLNFITEQSTTENISVFPNPATGIVKLDFKAKNSSAVSARIIDIAGREVMSVNMGKAYVGQSNFQMDMSSLAPGVYVVEIRQEGIRAIGRVSKN